MDKEVKEIQDYLDSMHGKTINVNGLAEEVKALADAIEPVMTRAMEHAIASAKAVESE